jgi:hypothetical protein
MHNVWLQQFGKRGTCLYVVTLNDYVQAFKQLTLYSHFKQGGRLGQGPDKNELLLHIATQFRDVKQLVDAVLKYSQRSACTNRIAHMEGEEIFGSYKSKVIVALGLEGDSHRHDHVSFSHPCVNHTIVKSSVEIEQLRANQIQEVIEVLEAPHGDGVWHIKRCPPHRTFNIPCCKNPLNILVLQK